MEVKFQMSDKEIAAICKAETRIAAKWVIKEYIKEHKNELAEMMIDKATEEMVKRTIKETIVELLAMWKGGTVDEVDLSGLIGTEEN